MVSGYRGNTEYQGENDPSIKCKRDLQYMTQNMTCESSFRVSVEYLA